MKIHWRTEDRWLREFRAGKTFREVGVEHFGEGRIRNNVCLVPIVEDAIRRAILRRKRRSSGTFGLYDGLPGGTAAEYLADVQTRAKWAKE